uniref:Acetyl-coenzyme A carboxylase carboxyl transferase subunit beta, chloroplastic n=1 Tax=Utricularia amethystina TaxID=192273 RepID=A0A650DPF9_9LAMI|nr:acetyl-CoA carboxylase carboxyltransferase beta subunit [Utricularia amethystina]
MERWWFNLLVLKKELERKYGINKSTYNLGPIENTSENKDANRKDSAKNIHRRGDSSYSNVNHFFGVKDTRHFFFDDPFLVRDSSGNSYFIDFYLQNKILEIDNDHPFLSELENSLCSFRNSSYMNNRSPTQDQDYFYNHYNYMYDTESSWRNYITSCIDNYLKSQVTSTESSSSNSYISSLFSDKRRTSIHVGGSSIPTRSKNSDLTLRERFNDLNTTQKYRHLWIQCENCYGLNYKKLLSSKLNICEQCGYHLKMSSSERIEVSVDPGTWDPLDEDMVSRDPLGFFSEENPYKNYMDSYQRKTGLTEAVQTGVGQINGIPVAIGIMDFQFLGGSMGSVVGEKITRLVEYATNQFLPLILVCASGGARMQEGSLSLMQMAKISSSLYDYQSNKKLFYVTILTSPTTGGVTASFGMLGDIIIAEPNSYIAFAGKRVIEQTLNKTVPEGLQAAEYLFHKGLFDLIVPRNLLKSVLGELFKLHGFFPFNSNSIK